MRNLKQTASDVRDLAKMLQEVADDLDRLSSIDLSALAALLGGGGAAEVRPKPLPKEPSANRKLGEHNKGRPLSDQEKEQMRLLWSQSNKTLVRVAPISRNLQNIGIASARNRSQQSQQENPDERLERLIKEAGAVLVRHNKHLCYKLANGKTLVVSRTASDWRSNLNTIANLKRLMGWSE